MFLPPQLKEGFDHLSAALAERQAALAGSQQREKRSAALVHDLTAMVKEQKSRIAELLKAKKEAVSELRVRGGPREREREGSEYGGGAVRGLREGEGSGCGGGPVV